VCLSRDHEPPIDIDVSLLGADQALYSTDWQPPDDADARFHANFDDATEIGAYCVALAAAYPHLGRKALSRTGMGTGGDWWLIPIDAEVGPAEYDLDRPDLVKLEVSGVAVNAEYEAGLGFERRSHKFEKVDSRSMSNTLRLFGSRAVKSDSRKFDGPRTTSGSGTIHGSGRPAIRCGQSRTRWRCLS
jgi:hypothetical protein